MVFATTAFSGINVPIMLHHLDCCTRLILLFFHRTIDAYATLMVMLLFAPHSATMLHMADLKHDTCLL